MAMAKPMYEAPQGLEQLAPQDDLEIEIIPDDEDGESEAEVGVEPDEDEEFNENLAESMDAIEMATMASELITEYDEDVGARKEWMQTYVDGLELLGLKIEERMEPWPGACGVYHPLLAEALVKFQAETMMATFPSAGPVKTLIRGKETPAKKEASARVQEDMNYQLMDEMSEYRPEHERMLWGLGLAGNAFKKVYYDPALERQVSIFVPAEDIVVPYGASNIETTERVTHVMRKTENELKKLQVAGFYLDEDLGAPNNVLDEVEKKIAEKLGFRASTDSRYKLLEMQVYKVFEDDKFKNKDGIALPYIVTIEKGSNKILAIRRNWKKDDATYAKRQHLVHYGYIPGFGFYYFGLIHLVGAFAKSGTSILRQLVDAGTLSNLPGGFKTRGMRIKGDDTPIAPGEFRDADVPSGVLKDNVMTLPYKEPSQVLAGLMDKIIEDGRRFANTADLDISDMSANSPVGTTLAILERTLKVMSAVQARIHYSMKQELGLLKTIIADYTPEDYDYDPAEGSRKAKKSDYDDVDVIPVSDPNASTMAQKIVQYQAVLQLAQSAPQIYNMPMLHRQMLDVLGIKNAEKLVPTEDDQKPQDPITENQNILMMKPVKAFLYQYHQAHIAIHMAATQDPKIISLLQNNPQAPQIQAGMMAHVNEHLGMEYRKQIEQQLGMALPAQKDEAGDDVNMAPEVEARLAPLLAQAAQQLLQKNQKEVQQQQAQQQAQDPLVQLQQQETEIKKMEVQRKAAKDQADNKINTQKLMLESVKIGMQNKTDMTKFKAQQQTEGVRIGVDAQKHQNELATQEAKSHKDNRHDMTKTVLQQSHAEDLAIHNANHEKETARMKAEHEKEMLALQPKPEKPAKKGK